MVHLNRPESIIFDLDGTLINSAPDIAGAFNKVMTDMGHDALPVSYVEKFIGNGPRALVQHIFMDLGIAYDDASLDTKVAEYIYNYNQNPVQKTHFFPYVKQDLKTLKSAGFQLGICTNKPHALTAIVLEKLGVKEYFNNFVGADAVLYCKPHANHLETLMDKMGVNCNNSFYVGDTEVDRACAHSAKTPFFIVPWGGGGDMLQDNDYKISRLSDLLNYFK